MKNSQCNQLPDVKFQAPKGRADTISRDRLYRLLEREAAGGIFSIVAPAGFGKTTLLAQWHAQRNGPGIWYSLESCDNHADTIWHGLVTAFENAGLTTRSGKALLECSTVVHERRWMERYAAELNRTIETNGEPLVWVIDNYHLLDDADIHQTLARFLSMLSGRVTVYLLSRREIPEALNCPVASSAIGSQQLLFTAAECKAYVTRFRELRRGGSEASHRFAPWQEEVASIWHHSEGWPAIFCVLWAGWNQENNRQPGTAELAVKAKRKGMLSEVHALSKREREVLELIVTGFSNPDIAIKLCRSLGTVKIHVHNIYRKLGVSNRAHAINKYHRIQMAD